SLDGMFSIRRGEWKLILGLGSGGFSEPRRVDPEPGGPEGQLYNIIEDPQETTNLWQDEPAIVERLTSLLRQYREEGRSVER
ncbi:MAG: sulfatase family protein, partial [Armatimonadota bacterium]